MRRTKFQRILAFALALTFVLGGMLGVSAADTSTSVTETDISDIKALLNAISYSDYLENTKDVESATDEIVIDVTKGYTYTARDGKVFTEATDVSGLFTEGGNQSFAYVGEFDGKEGLYVPGNGAVSWTTDAIKKMEKFKFNLSFQFLHEKMAKLVKNTVM